MPRERFSANLRPSRQSRMLVYKTDKLWIVISYELIIFDCKTILTFMLVPTDCKQILQRREHAKYFRPKFCLDSFNRYYITKLNKFYNQPSVCNAIKNVLQKAD